MATGAPSVSGLWIVAAFAAGIAVGGLLALAVRR